MVLSALENLHNGSAYLILDAQYRAHLEKVTLGFKRRDCALKGAINKVKINTKIVAALMFLTLMAGSFYLFSSTHATKAAINQGFVGIILPDTSSSTRWKDSDRQALLTAFSLAGIRIKIENAAGNQTAFKTIADRLLTQGAKVLVIANLDSNSAKQVEDKATTQGVPVIDYDRLTSNGSSSYFVTFDGEKIGNLQAQALNECLAAKKVVQPNILLLRGPDSDENATNVSRGNFSVLTKKFQSGAAVLAENIAIPDWNPI